ncbi:MAG: GH39 family glycosyl hydrolase [Metallibacterium sp.]
MIRAQLIRRSFAAACALSLLTVGAVNTARAASTAAETVYVHVDAQAPGTVFPHFWEQMFGSGRAVLALRSDYRRDITMVKQATGFTYVRAHGIFDRGVGLFHLDKQGKPVYNFSYVDQIYDGLLARGVKPFVELSFMPPDLASNPKDLFAFWYHPNVSPPKSYALWDGMIKAFARHLIKRYGIDEVATWYFEVWNEPNLRFWGGKPAQATYFKLYDNTARALKSVSPRLRVGGPATAQAAWVPAFLAHTWKDRVPVDFVSTHVYGDDTAQNVFHVDEHIPRRDMVCRAVDAVHKQIEASPYPRLPLIVSEYNATYRNLPNVTDSAYMGPWLANTIRQCAGKVDMMSYWAFSDVFEEQGVVKTPFYGGYGLIAEDRIPKPAFNAFALLHKLGHTRLPVDSHMALATRRKDGSVVLALWNYAPPVGTTASYTFGKPQGASKQFIVKVSHLAAGDHATVWRLGRHHGDVIRTFNAMGRPAYPSREQIKVLRQAAKLAAPRQQAVHDGMLRVDIPPQGLVVVVLH